MTLTANPPIKIYIKKTGTRITFKIKTWYYFEHLIIHLLHLLPIHYLVSYELFHQITYF